MTPVHSPVSLADTRPQSSSISTIRCHFLTHVHVHSQVSPVVLGQSPGGYQRGSDYPQVAGPSSADYVPVGSKRRSGKSLILFHLESPCHYRTPGSVGALPRVGR